MKITIRILTVYMILLSLVPCGDGGGGIIEIANNFLGITHDDYSDHKEHSNDCGDDYCTPFCVCSCCASVLDYPIKLALKIKAPALNKNIRPSFSCNLIFFSFSTDVWQPPKFS